MDFKFEGKISKQITLYFFMKQAKFLHQKCAHASKDNLDVFF